MKHIIKILGILPILAGKSLAMETLNYDTPPYKSIQMENKKTVEDNIFLAVERAEGKEEGLAIGKEIGKEIGKKEGEQTKAKEIALKMLLKGMSEKDIMTLTELSMEEIEELKNK